MKIREVMAKPVFISPDATKEELFATAKKHQYTGLFLVVGKDKKFLGDISEEDLFLMELPNERYDEIDEELGFDLQKKFFATKASELMRRHDITCCEDDELMDVALRLAGEEVNEMPVLSKGGEVVGVITEGILLRHLDEK